jgi:hypothetical protein
VSDKTSTGVRYVAAAIGVLLLLVELPFAFASGLMAPLWAVVLIVAAWCVLFMLAVRWFRRRPLWVLASPFVGAAAWFVVLTLGEQTLGWTA